MRKSILLTALAISCTLSSISQADVIKCTFTEPFFDTTYNTSESTLTYKLAYESEESIIQNVSFQIKSAGVFELVDPSGKVLQTLTLNYQGSNGMSDTIYPYEVLDSSQIAMANLGYGGCTSDHLQSQEPQP